MVDSLEQQYFQTHVSSFALTDQHMIISMHVTEDVPTSYLSCGQIYAVKIFGLL